MTRHDGRAPDQLRPIRFRRGFAPNAEGSVLVEVGDTRVLCTVSASSGVPSWRQGSGAGWLTAEYAMLPGSVRGRKRRETERRDARSIEIQRLIARSLRAALDLTAIPNLTLTVDCDVVQADGGTRCASITGGMVALHDALKRLAAEDRLAAWPLRRFVAAVSVGLVGGTPLLDLDYREDFAASVDMNVVGVDGGLLVEVQGTAEGDPFRREEHDALLDLAQRGVRELIERQRAAVAEPEPSAP